MVLTPKSLCAFYQTPHTSMDRQNKGVYVLVCLPTSKMISQSTGALCLCACMRCARCEVHACTYACCTVERGHLCPERSYHCGCGDLTEFRQVTEQRDIHTRAELTVSANKDQPQSEPSCYRHPWNRTHKHSQCQLLETPPTYEHSSVEIRMQLPNKQRRISKPWL